MFVISGLQNKTNGRVSVWFVSGPLKGSLGTGFSSRRGNTFKFLAHVLVRYLIHPIERVAVY
jgi:hypothetical protein